MSARTDRAAKREAADRNHATTAGRALLASGFVNQDPEALDVIRAIPPDLWPDDTGRAIAEAVTALHTEGAIIDATTVTAYLMREGNVSASAFCEYALDGPHTREGLSALIELGGIMEKYYVAQVAGVILPRDPDAAARVIAEASEWRHRLEVDRVLRLDDIIGAGEVPEPVLPFGPRRGNLNLIIASPGIGKSWVTLDLGAGLVAGAPMGIRTVGAVRTVRVLYLSYEDPPEVLRDRLDKLFAIRKRADLWAAVKDGRMGFHSPAGPIIVQDGIGRPVRVTDLFRDLKRTIIKGEYDLVVIDPLSCALSLANENDNLSMGQASQALAQLGADTNCAIVLVHHASKQGSDTSSQNSARGATALTARARWVAMLTRQDGGDIKLAIVKANYGAPPPRTILLRRNPHGPLEEIDLEAERGPKALVTAVCEAIGQNGVQAVTMGNIKQKLGDGKIIIERVQDDYPWASPKNIAEGAEMALRQGRLVAEEITHNKRKTPVLRVVPGFTETNYYEDNDDDAPF
jgi:hypothetical protein